MDNIMTWGPTANNELVILCQAAKSGHKEATFFLKEKFNMRVYTNYEIERINLYISEGLTLDEAIRRLDGNP
jgi:hypothetical protein